MSIYIATFYGCVDRKRPEVLKRVRTAYFDTNEMDARRPILKKLFNSPKITAMLSNGYYNKLIEKLREKVPKNSTLAHDLIDILCLSKESVYRRLRGEVAFTLDEIGVLVKHYDISLDAIFRGNETRAAVFDVNIGEEKSPAESYTSMLMKYSDLLSTLKEDPMSEYNSASNTLPTPFFVRYENLMKFRLFKHVSYLPGMNSVRSIKELDVPQNVLSALRILSRQVMELPSVNLIWDDNIFTSLAKEVIYFRKLNMLDDDDVNNIRLELMSLIDELEFLATKGRFPTDNPVYIYISNINFEATYSYMEKKGMQTCFLRIYSLGSIDTSSEVLCAAHKSWIQSLKRHSTLISQSGEFDRIKFFGEQRDIINSLLASVEEEKLILI